jgi:hypothetical protein
LVRERQGNLRFQMLLLRLLRTKLGLALLRFAWRRRGGLLGALRRAR